MTQKRHKLLTKAILIFIVALSANLVFKLAPAKAAEVGCCQVTFPYNNTFWCLNTLSQNCPNQEGDGTNTDKRLFLPQSCSAITACTDRIMPYSEADCNHDGCGVCSADDVGCHILSEEETAAREAAAVAAGMGQPLPGR